MNFKYEGKGYYYTVENDIATLFILQKKRTQAELTRFVDNALKKSTAVYYAATKNKIQSITVKEYTENN